MLRRRIALIATLALFSVLLTPSPAYAVAGAVKAMSHHHPDADFSYVAARIKGTRAANVEAHLAGPAVKSTNPVTCRIPRDRKFEGKVLVVWKIEQAGNYQVHLTLTKSGDTASDSSSHEVPDPSGAKWGPFRFPKQAGCHKGWPTK